jgi:hypothetical protein
MIRSFILFTALSLILAGCATATLSVSPEARGASLADKTLFHDLLKAVGGVGFVDRVYYPNAQKSNVIRIEVVAPYNAGQSWSERWHIQHDGQETATYIIRFTPDGKGGTYFSTNREKPESQPSGQ